MRVEEEGFYKRDLSGMRHSFNFKASQIILNEKIRLHWCDADSAEFGGKIEIKFFDNKINHTLSNTIKLLLQLCSSHFRL